MTSTQNAVLDNLFLIKQFFVNFLDKNANVFVLEVVGYDYTIFTMDNIMLITSQQRTATFKGNLMPVITCTRGTLYNSLRSS